MCAYIQINLKNFKLKVVSTYMETNTVTKNKRPYYKIDKNELTSKNKLTSLNYIQWHYYTRLMHT